MLRFNGRELAYLAHQPAHRFDKEGLLFIKEKQDGLFRKSEVYAERLFRLRGNLLFYFKTKDPHSEPIGVFVMERCVVELDPDEKRDFSFILAFSGDDKPIQLAAKSEPERDSWIAALHISSYECLRMQLDSLREQLRMRTGKDPIDDPDPSYLQDDRPETDTGEEPFFELCIKCEQLASESQSRMPNAFVSVCYQSPPHHQWVTHGHTEIVERNDTPSFMTTIAFSDPVKVNMDTKLRFIVSDVKERMTSTHYLSSLRSTVKMTQIGVAILPLRDLMAAPGLKITLQLQSTDFEVPGSLTVVGWFNFLPDGLLHENNSTDGAQAIKVHMQPLSPTTEDKMSRMECLMPLFANIIVKTYQFPTNLGGDINVHEYMAESRLTYILPRQLLSLWVAEEQEKIQHLNDLGKLSEPWENARQELMDFHMSMITMYKQNARYLSTYQGAPFKPSSRKADKEVEFAPVNLHLQRMWVHNNAANTSGCYDIITMGGFTAYAQKYKNGGLQRMIKELSTNYGGNSGKNCVTGGGIDTINEILNSMTMLKNAVYDQCEVLCRSAVQGDFADLNTASQALSDKTRQLLQVCDHHKIDQGVTCYEEAKREPRAESANHSHDNHGHDLKVPAKNSRNPSPETTWKWSGTNFVKSPTEEPWELTRLNTEAALVCVTSKIEDLVKGSSSDNDMIPQTKWLEEISSPVIKFKSCVEMTTKRVEASLTMLTIQACKNNIHWMHRIKYRRDVVFAQALTTAVTGFMTKLLDNVNNEKFLRQISQLGVLMEFESLLTSHADEMGMLEDYAVGTQDLSHVAFKIVQCKSDDEVMPTIQGTRTGYFVNIPVAESSFQKLPKEIQHGHAIRLVPILFTIGINEHASFAERFGVIAVQEQINLESFKRLNSYCEKYVEILGEPENLGTHGGLLMEAMRHLSMNVMAKKSKNVEVLHRAADVCRRLNGVRFSSCKSGKDRTSMSATLEQAQNLLREHDLASHAFSQALDCMRSEGVRRENTLKNAGVRRYAFNCLQLLSFPKLYRPPSGTYGNAQS